jgi:GH25 family lysozyme M1 (1,4-beta-N-acetylmuramidase)
MPQAVELYNLLTQGVSLVTIYYPDLSNNDWQPGDDVESWLKDCIFNEGYSAICHKVTQGASFQDAYWGTVHAWCANNDVPLIGYHFVNTDDPAAQAANWVNWVGWEVPCMLDFEPDSTNPDAAQFWAVVDAFNNAGVQIALSYYPRWYWEQLDEPDLSQVPGLVSSDYSYGSGYGSVIYWNADGDSGPGWAPYGGGTPVIWQFTNQASIGGKTVDCNAFQGTVADLQALLGGAPAPSPTPAPTPAPTPSPPPPPPPPGPSVL